MCIYIYIYIYTYVNIYLSLSLSLYIYIYMYVDGCLQAARPATNRSEPWAHISSQNVRCTCGHFVELLLLVSSKHNTTTQNTFHHLKQIYIYVYMCMCVYIYIYMYTSLSLYVYTYIYIYIYICKPYSSTACYPLGPCPDTTIHLLTAGYYTYIYIYTYTYIHV